VEFELSFLRRLFEGLLGKAKSTKGRHEFVKSDNTQIFFDNLKNQFFISFLARQSLSLLPRPKKKPLKSKRDNFDCQNIKF